MQNETRQCQNCKNDFIIEPEDFNFYEKIKVPPPTWCSECRMIRRLSFMNTWNICWRDCDKCKEKILSRYLPSQRINVFCQKCWWADDWDGTEYAMDYDSTRPFLEQIKELIENTPYVAVNNLYSSNKNCTYVNSTAWSKNCYLTFFADFCEDVYYSSILNKLKHSADCLRSHTSELCYESIGIYKCYQTYFSEECDNCVNVYFSRNCYGCTNCIGCVNLRNESNCIFNIKYSKEEFEIKVKELKINSWKSIQKLKEEAKVFWLTKPYREYIGNALNLNVTGEYVFESKNAKNMYMCGGVENSKWCQFITVKPVKDCMDYSCWGNNANKLYECQTVGENADSVFFSSECWPNVFNLQYCIWNTSCSNNFGCVNLKKKNYCILNKQYSKESFDKLRTQIIEDMKKNPYVDKTGRKYFYGEFFPLDFSEFGYNKSNAMRFFSKTKEEALKEGYHWVDEIDSIKCSSVKESNLPDTIEEAGEDILNEIIECKNCKKGYKITKGEFDLLIKMNLPIPHECPKCRENERFSKINLPKFYNRNCAKCSINIYTAHAPDRPEIVYCVKCYQQEFA